MAIQQEEQTNPFDRANEFLKKNMYYIIGAIALIVILAGYRSYSNAKNIKADKEASELIFQAEQAFAQDSFNLALNGNTGFDGFLTLIDDFGSTKTGNLAKFYAGACYVKLGQFEEGIDYLKSFDATDDKIEAHANELIGKSYAELGELDKAAKYYKKSANSVENAAIAPYYLLNAGNFMLYAEKWNDAEAIYTKLVDAYPNTNEADEATKHLEYVKTKMN